MTWFAFPNLLILSYVQGCTPRAIQLQYRFRCNPQSTFLPSDILLSTRDGMEVNLPLYLTQFPRLVDVRGNGGIVRIFYVYGSVHHNIFYEITNRCSYLQSILFHC